MDRNDVICAISTAPGVGAIAVLRLSGAGAIALTDRVFVSPSGKNLADVAGNTVHFGRVMDGEEPVDEVLETARRLLEAARKIEDELAAG